MSDACACPFGAIFLKVSVLNCVCSAYFCKSLFLGCSGWRLLLLDSDLWEKFLANCLSFVVGVEPLSLLLPSLEPAANLGPPLIPGTLSWSCWSALPTVLVARTRRGCTARIEGTLKFPMWVLSRDSWRPHSLASGAAEWTLVLVDLLIGGEPRAFEDVTEIKGKKVNYKLILFYTLFFSLWF